MKDKGMELTYLNIMEVLLANQKLAAILDRILTDIWSRVQTKTHLFSSQKSMAECNKDSSVLVMTFALSHQNTL